jgi:DNA-binding MarR family transcriptional regulator
VDVEDDAQVRGAAVVRRGAVLLTRRMRAQRVEGELPLLAVSVLSYLTRYGPATATQLADADRLKPQTLTRTLNRLEADGLIKRKPDESDHRQSLITITPQGRRRLRDEVHPRDVWLATAMAQRLTPTERELLLLAGQLMMRLADDREEPYPDGDLLGVVQCDGHQREAALCMVTVISAASCCR